MTQHGARMEGAAARALRALDVSGRRLVARASGWAVIGQDARRRPFVLLREGEALSLVSAGLVHAAVGGGFVLADDARGTSPAFAAAGNVAGFGETLAQARTTRRADFAGLAAQARRGEGPLSLRAALAGFRIAREAESASRRPSLTMNWSATPMDRGRSRAGRDGLGDAPRAAALRLEGVAAALPAPGLAFVLAACVEGRGLRALEQRFALQRGCGGAMLARLLEMAADVLDAGG